MIEFDILFCLVLDRALMMLKISFDVELMLNLTK
jgi:hypothetical protein